MTNESQPATATSTAQAIQGIIGVVFGVGMLWFLIGGGVENKVAKDAEAQYSIAARSGTAIDRCVHAGFVAAAYLQGRIQVRSATKMNPVTGG